jgi:hypothetical protein
MANILKTEKKVTVVSMLAEGSSMASIARITGIHPDTIMRLAVRRPAIIFDSSPRLWTWSVCQPFCDESGVGFGARRLAENSTALWSHHSIPRSDEIWLPEWSGNLGGVQRWRSSVAGGVLGQASLPAI